MKSQRPPSNKLIAAAKVPSTLALDSRVRIQSAWEPVVQAVDGVLRMPYCQISKGFDGKSLRYGTRSAAALWTLQSVPSLIARLGLKHFAEVTYLGSYARV